MFFEDHANGLVCGFRKLWYTWETGLKPDSETETGLKPDSETETGLKPDSETETGLKPDSETETGLKPDSETETGLKPEVIYGVADGFSNGRLSMWKNTLVSYQKLPLMNKLVGSGNKYLYDHNWGLSSHTDYLNILHFHGVIGLLLYLTVFVGYVACYWYKNKYPLILLVGFWGVWFCMAMLNGYASYTANMMSLPYIALLADWTKRKSTQTSEEGNSL